MNILIRVPINTETVKTYYTAVTLNKRAQSAISGIIQEAITEDRKQIIFVSVVVAFLRTGTSGRSHSRCSSTAQTVCDPELVMEPALPSPCSQRATGHSKGGARCLRTKTLPGARVLRVREASRFLSGRWLLFKPRAAMVAVNMQEDEKGSDQRP